MAWGDFWKYMLTKSLPFVFALLFVEASVLKSQDQLYMDAESITFKPKAGIQEFSGNVIFVGGDVMIAADHISLDSNDQMINANGKVVVVTSEQVFIGDKLIFSQNSGLFTLNNGHYIANSTDTSKKYVQQILGFSPQELDFEKKQFQRLNDIEKQKLNIAYLNHLEKDPDKRLALEDQYKNLSYKQSLIHSQENPEFVSLKGKLSKSIQKRRAFWKKSKFKSKLDFKDSTNKDYFRISGTKIARVSLKEYKTLNSSLTPCFCQEDQTPDWSFSASEINATKGGYATLKNSILKIKNLPILYIPYLKIPIKNQRQSGFLLPSYAWNQNSGSILELPFYFAISDSKDATLSTNLISQRGLLFDAEYRHKKSQYSGWNVRSKIIKDKKWQSSIAQRQIISHIYSRGLANARSNTSPSTEFDSESAKILERTSQSSYWDSIAETNCVSGSVAEQEECDRQLDSYGRSLDHVWRYDLDWRGLDNLTKNLKLKSVGSLVSDHRVDEDFYYSGDYSESLITQLNTKVFSRTATELAYHNDYIYTNFSSYIGDNLNSFESYNGYQIPIQYQLDTRLIKIPTPNAFSMSIYTQSQLSYKKIQLWNNQDKSAVLGSGSWGQLKQSFIVDLFPLKFLNINLFANTEVRAIEHQNLADDRTTFLSSKYGIELSLPLDGFMTLGPKNSIHAKSLQHFMDWRLKFSTRPYIDRNGPYASLADPNASSGYGKSYFFSDTNNSLEQIEEAVLDEDRMLKHRRVSLETSHSLKLYQAEWTNVPSYQSEPIRDYSKYSKDRLKFFDSSWSKLANGEELLMEDLAVPKLKNKLVNTPLIFTAKTEYDFIDAKLRKQQLKDSVPVDQQTHPWKDLETDLSLNTSYASFANTLKYDFKLKNLRQQKYSIWTPEFYKTTLGVGFEVEKGAIFYDEQNRIQRNKVKTRTVSLSSRLLPNLYTTISLGKRELRPTNEVEITEHQSQYTIGYTPTSNCWGWRFVRTKPYDQKERDANYLLEFQVNFAGQTRSLPNMSRPLEKLFL